ncbi:hypothetical protein AGMMS49545_01250 [Betaproteobacteria bacterium]|nr:hypothetical protein AGMMS49545_01250 [Betaproteobacteria bacterium]
MGKRKSKPSQKRAKNQPVFTLPGAANDFVRGFVSYSAVAALARRDPHHLPIFDAPLLKHATLTGTALVAAVAAGKAVERGHYLTAALSAVGSVVGVYALDRLLNSTLQEEQ